MAEECRVKLPSRVPSRISVPSLFSHRDEFVTPFDRVFNDIFGDLFPSTASELGMDIISKGAYPKVNVLDSNESVVIEAEIPGLAKEQVSVEVDHNENVLTIWGEKRAEKENKREGVYLFRELKQSAFSRSFQLNENLDLENIAAKFENGMLELVIPKKVPKEVEKKVQKVEIK